MPLPLPNQHSQHQGTELLKVNTVVQTSDQPQRNRRLLQFSGNQGAIEKNNQLNDNLAASEQHD